MKVNCFFFKQEEDASRMTVPYFPTQASAQRLVWAAMQPLRNAALALSLPDKELCLREALAVCTPPAPEPSAKRPGS